VLLFKFANASDLQPFVRPWYTLGVRPPTQSVSRKQFSAE
jgi:hypothetical protein